MNRKKPIKLPVIVLIAGVWGLTLSCFAATITLKTGSKFTAQILERTDRYIVVDFYGTAVNYNMYEIEEISEEETAELPTVTPQPTRPEPQSMLDWNRWYNDTKVTNYLYNVDSLMIKNKKSEINLQRQLSRAESTKDIELADRIVKRAVEQAAEIIGQLSGLAQPPEFNQYHQTLIAAYQNQKSAQQAILQQDFNTAFAYEESAIAAFIKAAEELKNIFIRHAAPQQAISALDLAIEGFRRQLP
ncbi:hypothetical protein ACFL2I_00240 [Candidatus Omnitrophota bacterium]